MQILRTPFFEAGELQVVDGDVSGSNLQLSGYSGQKVEVFYFAQDVQQARSFRSQLKVLHSLDSSLLSLGSQLEIC